ncbi:30S ribosomal protein S9 [Candidatus Gracilibacteria bacterium]|nr:30S ribosomal protein S9 [Candidatus Gracilibacteria bacterium]
MTLKKYTYAIGKRKTAIAQVRLFEGEGESKINGLSFKQYVKRSDLFGTLLAPLKISNLENKYYFEVKVIGSGESSQIQAIRLGISRALVKVDENTKKTLKINGLLTRDARKVERKKPGLHKARKATQWSKR